MVLSQTMRHAGGQTAEQSYAQSRELLVLNKHAGFWFSHRARAANVYSVAVFLFCFPNGSEPLLICPLRLPRGAVPQNRR